MGAQSKLNKKIGGRLGLHLVGVMVLISAVLSSIAAGVQLYSNYERERAHVIGSFESIERSFVPSLTAALWEFNFDQAETLLDGIASNVDVAYIEINAASGEQFIRGQADSKLDEERYFDLRYQREDGSELLVGRLQLGLSFTRLWADIRAQFLSIVLTNFVKTLVATGIMLILVYHFITRHLHRIAQTVSRTVWWTGNKSLALDRKKQSGDDDLDQVVDTLNRVRDELRQAIGELEQTNDQLMTTNREQSEFAYALSHDLKSPTNTACMLLNRLQESHRNSLDEEGQTLLDASGNTLNRMGNLISDVSQYARAVNDIQTHELVDLNQLFDEIIADNKADLETANAELDRQPLPELLGIPSQIRVLFHNLLSNAIKFRDANRQPLIRISSQDQGTDEVAISVSDNGIGIQAKYNQQIFSLFQRLHTYDEYPGSGLGLALCTRVVSNHNGRIDVISTPGEGSEFRIIFRKPNAS